MSPNPAISLPHVVLAEAQGSRGGAQAQLLGWEETLVESAFHLIP